MTTLHMPGGWKRHAGHVFPGETDVSRLKRHSWTEGYEVRRGQPAPDELRNSRNNSPQPGLASMSP